MDTGSHLLFGATLGGLALIDPVVAQQPALAHAVLAGTLIGSHAPDFDTIVRLKGYSAYIRYHRGVTHSLPALLVWPLVISAPLAWLFGVSEHWIHLFAFTFIAVFFHVFLDLFNAYGVQCLRPFTRRWLHLDSLTLYDPFLFVLHVAGLALWIAGWFQPGGMFAIIYAVTLAYIAWRTAHHHLVVKRVLRQLNMAGSCQAIPDLHWFKWQFVVETDRYFYTGLVRYREVIVKDIYEKNAETAAIKASAATDGVRSFLSFAERIHVICNELQEGYEVQWRDVRFWYNHKLTFGVDVWLDRNMNVLKHDVGWRKKSWDPPYV